jgi:hypothetical protein
LWEAVPVVPVSLDLRLADPFEEQHMDDGVLAAAARWSHNPAFASRPQSHLSRGRNSEIHPILSVTAGNRLFRLDWFVIM